MDPLPEQGMIEDIEDIEFKAEFAGELDCEAERYLPVLNDETKIIVEALCQIARILARIAWDFESVHGIEHERQVKEVIK